MRPHVELIQEDDYIWHPAEITKGEGKLGNYQFNKLDSSSWTYENPPVIYWQQATSTTTPNFQVAVASSIPFGVTTNGVGSTGIDCFSHRLP